MAVVIKKSSALNKLNLTPMIDVVFQLLIFFLVAAKFEEEERNMPLPLPQASEAMPRACLVVMSSYFSGREWRSISGTRRVSCPSGPYVFVSGASTATIAATGCIGLSV